MKPLLVGEDNPYGSDPRYALFPHPQGSAGYRLARLVLAMPSRQAYLETFDRVNLCAGKWSMPEAREKATEIQRTGPDKIVLLGSKVCKAFGYDYEPFTHSERWAYTEQFEMELSPEPPAGVSTRRFTAVILPHPSGLCRLWNEPGAFERAQSALRIAGVLPPRA